MLWQGTADVLIPQLVEALSFDNQVSVKHTIEWTMVFLLAKCPRQSSTLLRILDYVSMHVAVVTVKCCCYRNAYIAVG